MDPAQKVLRAFCGASPKLQEHSGAAPSLGTSVPGTEDKECSGCRWGLTLLAVHFPHKGRMKGSKLCAKDKGSRAAAHDRRLSLAQMRPRDALGSAQPGSWSRRTPGALTLRAPRLCTFLYSGLEFKARDADLEGVMGRGGGWGCGEMVGTRGRGGEKMGVGRL